MRVVHCTDALTWLESQPVMEGCSFVASMPDVSEFPSLKLDEWKHWFITTAALILSRCPDNGVTIFYQTDIKLDGAWVDKAYLCQRAADAMQRPQLWHKIVCRAPAGLATFGRPAYGHLLCFSKGVRDDVARSTPDVLPDKGEQTWARGMGVSAALAAVNYILSHTETRTVVNPFCGEGSVLAAANSVGLEAIGIEKNRKRAEKAQDLLLEDGDWKMPDNESFWR